MSVVWVDHTKIGRKVAVVDDAERHRVEDAVESDRRLGRPGPRPRREPQVQPAQDAPPEGELGSAWERYRLYAYYENGDVFEQGPIETLDYEDMISKDGIGRALEQVLTLPMRSIDWTLKPGTNDSGELAFVTEALTTPAEMGGMEIPIETVIGQMTSAVLYRRAHFEKVFRVDGDKVTYDKIAYRPPTTCYLARAAKDASFQGFMQWTWEGLKFVKVIIPKNKAFVYLHGTHRNPLEGISDLDVAYNAWQSKQKLRFLWYQFLETQAAPRTTVTVGSSDQGVADSTASRISKLKGGGVAGLIEGETVDIIESNGSGAAQYAAAMAYLDQEMLQSCLAGFLGLTSQATGHSGSGQTRGSNNLAQGMAEFYLQSRQAVLKEMGAAFTNGIIRDLVTYNFGKDGSCPTLEFGDLAQSDAADKAFALLQGIASAATPTPLLPYGFIDQLIEKVATFLDLDIDVVTAAIAGQTHSASETPGDALAASMPLHQAINGAADLVVSHTGGNNRRRSPRQWEPASCQPDGQTVQQVAMVLASGEVPIMRRWSQSIRGNLQRARDHHGGHYRGAVPGAQGSATRARVARSGRHRRPQCRRSVPSRLPDQRRGADAEQRQRRGEPRRGDRSTESQFYRPACWPLSATAAQRPKPPMRSPRTTVASSGGRPRSTPARPLNALRPTATTIERAIHR